MLDIRNLNFIDSEFGTINCEALKNSHLYDISHNALVM